LGTELSQATIDQLTDSNGYFHDSTGLPNKQEHDRNGGHFERRYQTKAEKIADLKAYLMDLKLEVQAVEEHLADLRK
jgi:hypothetical protein